MEERCKLHAKQMDVRIGRNTRESRNEGQTFWTQDSH